MGLYIVVWHFGNKRGHRKEQERVQALRESGWLKEKQDAEEVDGQYTTEGITTM